MSHRSADNGITLLDLREQIIAGRFQLRRRIRRGSYAEVWLADNLAPKEGEPPVMAVKILNLGLQRHPEAQMETVLIDNIKLEDYSLRTLRHFNIVRLFESGEDVDRRTGRRIYYLVLELLDGGDLYSLCHNRPLSLENALPYIAQACAALTFAHQHGIVHRDIKPNNFLLTDDGAILKTLDFGTAFLLGKENGAVTCVGTPIYASPESYALRETVALSVAADVYSLAKVVLFMITGYSPAQWAQKQIVSLPPAIAHQPGAELLLSVLGKATADDATQRYQSVEDFQRALRQVLESTEVEVPGQARGRWQEEPHQYYTPPKHTRFEIPVPNAGVNTTNWPLSNVSFFSFTDRVFRKFSGLSTIPRVFALRILLVLVIVLSILAGLPSILALFRRADVPVASQNAAANPLVGREALTITDLHIRSVPGAGQPKIGLAQKHSRLRIRSSNADGTWHEVDVIEYSQTKKNPEFSDRGWVRSKFLTIK